MRNDTEIAINIHARRGRGKAPGKMTGASNAAVSLSLSTDWNRVAESPPIGGREAPFRAVATGTLRSLRTAAHRESIARPSFGDPPPRALVP